MLKFETVEFIVAVNVPDPPPTSTPNVTDEQFSVPAPEILALVLLTDEQDMLISVVMFSMTPGLMINDRAVAAPLLKVIELAVALLVTVTVAPGTITTLSVEIGATPPTHEVPKFQVPPAAVDVI